MPEAPVHHPAGGVGLRLEALELDVRRHLDREARNRGTSVYLPQRVLPMFPELISNGLASLQQGKRRYVKSVFMEFTADGHVGGNSSCNSYFGTYTTGADGGLTVSQTSR